MSQAKLIDQLKQIYNDNLNEEAQLDNTAFDERTKTGIRAYINKSNKIIRGRIAWEINHRH